MKADLQAKLEEIRAKKNLSATPVTSPVKPTKKIIKKAIQADVDLYITLDAQYKALEKTLKQMRGVIEPYMEENNISVIMGTDKGRIERTPTNRAIISAKYTSYLAYDVRQVLNPEILKEVLVEVVDKDMIDLYVKTGKIDDSIVELKQMSQSTNFSAKQI
jgi:hypothetical protein